MNFLYLMMIFLELLAITRIVYPFWVFFEQCMK